MKKVLLTILSCYLLSNLSFGQACRGVDTSGPSACTPGGFSGVGFQDPSTVPCIVQGVAYNYADQFNMYTTFDFLGHQNVDSIEILAINALPAGICWSTNHLNNRFKAHEAGCLNFKGTTTASEGQYKLQLDIAAWINGAIDSVRPGVYLVNQAGVRLWLRVITPTGYCAPVDTSKATDISAINAELSGLSIVPNPISNQATLGFNAEQNGVFTMKMSDMTGKIISTRELEVRVGENNFTIERNNLPSGIYFVSLNSGQSVVTRRFSIAD